MADEKPEPKKEPKPAPPKEKPKKPAVPRPKPAPDKNTVEGSWGEGDKDVHEFERKDKKK